MSKPTPSSEGFDETPILLTKDVMTSPLITASPGTNLMEAVFLMNNHRIGSLVVIDAGKPVGIVTERDIMTKVVGRKVSASDLKVANVMSTPVRSINEEEPLEQAPRIMARYGVRRLAVINKNGDLVGIITSSDLVREFPDIMTLLGKRTKLIR